MTKSIYKYIINYHVGYETLDGVKPNILLSIKQLDLLELIQVLILNKIKYLIIQENDSACHTDIKIKTNSEDDLPLGRLLFLCDVVIFSRSVLKNSVACYPKVFSEKS